MDKYINVNIFRKSLIDRQITDCFFNNVRRDEIGVIVDLLDKIPTADVVNTRTIEQLKWERDMAIKQLESYGVDFCEAAEVVRVKHGHWEPYGINPNGVIGNYHCTVCKGTSLKDSDYCPNCGAVMDEKE